MELRVGFLSLYIILHLVIVVKLKRKGVGKVAEEIKFTFKSAAVAAMIATLIMVVFGCMWGFHGRITTLEVQQVNLTEKLNKIDKVESLVWDIRQDQIRKEIQTKATGLIHRGDR